MKRLGPELKMPKRKGGDVKVPPFLSDLFFDLRERRLLPLVALLLVAIVAAPILLGSGSDEEEATPPPGLADGAPSTAHEQSLTVVKAEPGLRNYKKRLARRDPTNPFKQRYTAPQLAGSELNEQTSTSTSTSESTEVTVDTAPASSPNHSGGGNGGDPTLAPGELQLYSFAIDIKLSHTETDAGGATKMGEPVSREKVKRGTPLPGEKAPVLTFIGIDNEAGKALMLVSPEVVGLLGDNECVAGTSTCQLLALEPKVPEVVEYGPQKTRYKFELLNIEPIKGPRIKDPQGAQAEIPNG